LPFQDGHIKEVRDAAVAAGFESFFVKPVNPAQLIASIEFPPQVSA